jgi:hypothetical protein
MFSQSLFSLFCFLSFWQIVEFTKNELETLLNESKVQAIVGMCLYLSLARARFIIFSVGVIVRTSAGAFCFDFCCDIITGHRTRVGRGQGTGL